MVVMDYRTQDRLTDYGFSIEFQSDIGWRAYIISNFPVTATTASRCPINLSTITGAAT